MEWKKNGQNVSRVEVRVLIKNKRNKKADMTIWRNIKKKPENVKFKSSELNTKYVVECQMKVRKNRKFTFKKRSEKKQWSENQVAKRSEINSWKKKGKINEKKRRQKEKQ